MIKSVQFLSHTHTFNIQQFNGDCERMQTPLIVVVLLLAVGVLGVPTKSIGNNLNLVKLEDHPLAQCNDGTTAVYYRNALNSDEDTKKLMIYLNGGGFCVPHVPGDKNFS